MATFLIVSRHSPENCPINNEKMKKITLELPEKLDALEKKHGVRLFTMWGLFDDREKGFMIDHGAGNETSIMLAEKPELVKMQNLPEDTKEWPLGTAGDDPRRFASAEAGKKVVEANLDAMERTIRQALSTIQR